MLTYDMHIHSIRSLCGTMTLGEIVATAASKGLRGICVTDHGMAMEVPRFQFHIFCKRYPDMVDGVRVYKGIELNVLDETGRLDVPNELIPIFDYIAVGLHPVEPLLPDRGAEANTDALLTTLRVNPWIDALAHPTQRSHPLEFQRLLPAMAAEGIAFEVNECNLRYGKTTVEATAEALAAAVVHGVPIVANSDAHVFHELGEDDHINRVFQMADLDPIIAVNATEETLTAFLTERRNRRLTAQVDTEFNLKVRG